MTNRRQDQYKRSITPHGMTSKDFNSFIDLLIKSNRDQLLFMSREALEEYHKRSGHERKD